MLKFLLTIVLLFIVARFGIGILFNHVGALLLCLLLAKFTWWILTSHDSRS